MKPRTRIWHVDRIKGQMWEGTLDGYQQTYQALVHLDVDGSGWLNPYLVPRSSVFADKADAQRYLDGTYTYEQRRKDIENEIHSYV